MGLYKKKLNPFTGDFQLVFNGTIVAFKAGVATVGDLPTEGNIVGDARIVSANHNLYIWNGTEWENQGDIIDIDWASIENKPTSLVTDIDDAVTKAHTQNTDTILQFSEEVLDFSQDTIDDSYWSGADYSFSFVASNSGKLSKVALPLRKWTSPDDTTIKIYATDINHKPTGSVLATTTLVNADIPEWTPPNYEYTDFVFETSADIVLGTEYAIVITTNRNSLYMANSDVTAEGTYFHYWENDDWVDASDWQGGSFKVYVEGDTSDLINNGILKNDLAVDEGVKIGGNVIEDITDAVTKKHAHANKSDLDLVSGTNTGDQVASTVDTDASGVSVQDALNTLESGKEDSLGFTPENVANKKTTLADDSDTYYPSQKAVKTAVDAKSDKLITIVEKIDSHTLELTDANKLIDVNHADPKTITVPKNSVIAFSIGTTIAIRQKGAGTVTIAPVDGDVTIQNQDGLILTGQHALATLVKVATDTWVAFGSLE